MVTPPEETRLRPLQDSSHVSLQSLTNDLGKDTENGDNETLDDCKYEFIQKWLKDIDL